MAETVSTCGELADWLAGQPRNRMIALPDRYAPDAFAMSAQVAEGMLHGSQIFHTPEQAAGVEAAGEWAASAPAGAERVVYLEGPS